MTELALYFLKSASWLAGFTLVYMVFLRNERYFTLNRYYLLSGIVISFIAPFFTIHYAVYLQNPEVSAVSDFYPVETAVADSGKNDDWLTGVLLYSPFVVYAMGVVYLLSNLFLKTGSLLKTINKADSDKRGRIKLIRSSLFNSSFSFFSWVFINPSIPETETREILKHEEVHIRQKHWIDLIVSQLICIIQWFNPLVWVYSRFIRQNHEYLADDAVLRYSSDPALYRATLLNQTLGSPVFDLANFFSYSLTRKRFKMMKKIDYSPLRKLRILAILPVIALLLFAFAEPDYRYASEADAVSPGQTQNAVKGVVTTSVGVPLEGTAVVISGTTVGTATDPQGEFTLKEVPADSPVQTQNVVKGVVTTSAGVPLEGAAVVISGTTVGTTTDPQGKFTLKEVPADSRLMISYVGYKTAEVRPSGNGNINVKMEVATIGIETIEVRSTSAPGVNLNDTENQPMIMIDGKRVDNSVMKSIDPNSIETISVLKDQSATAVFGDAGKNGVIVVTTKDGEIKTSQEKEILKPVVVEGYASKETYTVVEEMPSFPGGIDALKAWIAQSIKYPEDAVKSGLSGEVVVSFVVNKAGKVQEVTVLKSVSPSLDSEAVRVIKSLPDWKPGKQSGKPVDVRFNIPVSFKI